MEIKCPKCGFVMPDDSSFCGRCGCDLTKSFCTKCGKPLVPDSKFCMYCGTPVNGESKEIVSQESEVEEVKESKKVESAAEIAEVKSSQEQAAVSLQNIEEPNHSFESETATIPAAEVISEKEYEAEKQESMAATEVWQQAENFTEKESAKLEDVIGKNVEYYMAEFRKIDAGEKTKFNWAAFFLVFAFCFYRKCGHLAKKYFLIPVILTLLTAPIYAIGMATFEFSLYTVASVVGIVGGIWIFVNAIRMGKTFNAKYYEHLQRVTEMKDEKRYGTSMKNAVISVVVYIVLTAVISSVSTSIGIAALGKAFSSETEHEAEAVTADLEKDSKDYVGDADLASFQGKWYGSNLDEYGNASASDLLGMELNISFIDGKGYANLNSNTNYFDSVFYEQTYQGDKLLPIKKVGDNKWQVTFDEKGESGQKLSVAHLTLTVNPLGELYGEISDSVSSNISRVQLYRKSEWLNGQYQYYEKGEAVQPEEYGGPLDVLVCEDILRDSVYGTWFDSTGTFAGTININPGDIYVYGAESSYYRDNSIYIDFSYQNDSTRKRKMQITGLEGEIYIDGECYTKDMADNPDTYSYDSFSNYILPTDSRYITYSDLAPFSKEEVALIRNEIYARYGCTFNNANYRAYFESQSWYYPVEGRNASNFDASMLNDYEVKNIDTIIAYEKQMGWR